METGLNKFLLRAKPSPNIPDMVKARQDLPLHDNQVGAFEPSLYSAIIQSVFTLRPYVTYNIQPNKPSNNNGKNK